MNVKFSPDVQKHLHVEWDAASGTFKVGGPRRGQKELVPLSPPPRSDDDPKVRESHRITAQRQKGVIDPLRGKENATDFEGTERNVSSLETFCFLFCFFGEEVVWILNAAFFSQAWSVVIS